MGFFLSSIKEQLPALVQHLPPHSHSFARVRQYHGIFKSVCTDFLISSQQFQQIFGSQQDLGLWGVNKVANALELFSGLAFYAEGCSFRAKLRFLFALFDFNEIKSISIVDLECMLLSICDFTYKILGKLNTRADQLQLAQWLAQRLDPRKRVTVTKLYRMCAQARELRPFLRVAGATEEELQAIGEQQDVREQAKVEKEGDRSGEIGAKLNWLNSLCSKLTKPKYKKEAITNGHLNWVYGIEISKIRRPLIVMEGPIMIYAISNKMVVFNQPCRRQQIYSCHVREITAFCLRKDNGLVASAQGVVHPHIYLWRYGSLQTVHILRLDHSHRISLLCFAEHQPLLAVVGERQDSPVLLFQTIRWSLKTSLRLDEPVGELVAFSSPLPHELTPASQQGCFILSGLHRLAVVSEAGVQHSTTYDISVTALAVSLMSCEFPHLRFFSGDNLRLFIVTGHSNGAVLVWQLGLDEAEGESEAEKTEIMRAEDAIRQLIVTSQALLVACGQEIRVYDLAVVLGRSEGELQGTRCIRLGGLQHLRLISPLVRYMAVTEKLICALSEEGELMVIQDRELLFEKGCFREREAVRRVPSVVKFSGEMRALCFLQRQLHNVLLVVSQRCRILQIDPETHQIEFILNIPDIAFNDLITVIDSAVTQQGTNITICGFRSGKLVLWHGWQQILKAIDCGSQVCDVKISPQGNTLLVATTNTLLFFHLGPGLSSPRKLTFENQMPLSLAYLDNSKSCAVATSAKNLYLIDLPALKHRSVFKQVQFFTASRLPIAFPRIERQGSASQCMVGGDMKFYLIGLQGGQLLYFPSMSSLQRRNYLILGGHCCPISKIVVTEEQNFFCTLGEQDGMLLQWSVTEQFAPHKNKSSMIKSSYSNQSRTDLQGQFQNIKRVSLAPPQTPDHSLSTFFMRGTKSKKLNRSLRLQLKTSQQGLSEEEQALSKRYCNYALQTKAIYGLQIDKSNQVRYRYPDVQDSTIIYASSRFIIQGALQTPIQNVNECGRRRIAFVQVGEQGKVIWAEVGPKPWIWQGTKRCLQTTHQNGLLHFAIFKDFILSYGLSDNSYTLNLHNFRTQQLLAQRTTDQQIIQCFILGQQEFVTISQVRRWVNLVTSESMGVATAGAVLRNGRDVCLGGIAGQLSVLCENGLVEVAHQAHSKSITAMKANTRQGKAELVTASLDQTIKIWNQFFEQLLIININFQNEFSLLIEGEGEMSKGPLACVRSLDCKGGRILAGFAHGQVWEYVVSTQFEKVAEGHQIMSEASIRSQISDPQKSKSRLLPNDHKHMVFKAEPCKLLDAHASGLAPNQRYLVFDVHVSLPLLATAGNDGRLILLDYQRGGAVVGNYICDAKRKVLALRFSPVGRMLVVGLSGGVIMTFYLNILTDISGSQQIQLVYFQTFKPDDPLQIIDLQFDKQGQMFAVSYWSESRRGQLLESGRVRIFRVKSQKNHNANEAFYQPRESIQLREQQKSSNGLSKCVLRMTWMYAQQKHYLILYSQHLDSQCKPNHRGKYQTYCLEEKGYLSDEFGIDWSSAIFPNLLNVRAVGSDGEPNPEEYLLTAMHSCGKIILCGGIDGRIHLLRKSVLYSQQDCKQEDMCLSRVYNSHSSFITRILTVVGPFTAKRYVFAAAFADESLVQFQLIQQDPSLFLEHQPYPKLLSDSTLHGQCPPKDQFYLMLNNRQPLREELTSVLEDVQKTGQPQIGLTPVRVFGRRACDRRYNLAYFQTNALYSIGPNIVIQSLKQPESQQLMRANPSPLSHYPQISAIHYQGGWLGVATEQQHSWLFVWDICSRSCLSSMELQCVSVLMLRFLGESMVVLFGFNERYELVVQLVDWRSKKVIGRSRMAHSGNWVIRDITAVSVKADFMEFVTCGHLHLCYWQVRGDRLVYRSFNSQPHASYLSVRSLNRHIVSGCEEGSLYLWLNFQLLHVLKGQHQAAVRCIQADACNDIIISGGKDGLLLFLKIQQNKLCIFNRATLGGKRRESREGQGFEEEKAWKVQQQVQAIALSSQKLSQDFEKILVGTRSGAIYQVMFNEQAENTEVQLIFQGYDHQAIVGAAFSNANPNYFYTLSNAGTIDSWSLSTLTKNFSFQLGRRALKLQAWGQHLLVCCRNEVIVYKTERQGLRREEQFCIDTRRNEQSQSMESKQSEIVKMCLSQNGQKLGICIKICSKEPIYQISLYEFGQSKQPVYTLNNLKHEIDYLDFSTDDKFLLFKDRYEEIGMLALTPDKDYKRINTIFVQMNIEWQQQGLRISPHAQKIYYSYSCENKITAITRLGYDKIIVGDEMGTVRIFQYPCPDERLGQLHLQCYANHMNDISIVKVNSSSTRLITTALMDRSLILWKTEQLQIAAKRKD